jgi:alanyl-tRNA synthetase
MSVVEVRPFRRSDRDQLTALVNAHAQAVVPGASASVNAVMSQLERQPGEFIVDPWVEERVTLVAERVPDGVDAGGLRKLTAEVRNRLGSRPGVVALFSPAGEKVSFAVGATAAARDKGFAAGDLVKSFAGAVEGRGGGKPDLAQGGGANPAGVDKAIAALESALRGDAV